jgi:hypothetical protein
LKKKNAKRRAKRMVKRGHAVAVAAAQTGVKKDDLVEGKKLSDDKK